MSRKYKHSCSKCQLSEVAFREDSEYNGPQSVHVLHSMLLGGLGNSLLSLKKCLAVLVELECGDHAVRWVDWDLMLLSITLLSDDFLNVDAPSSAVDGEHLAFSALVGSAHNLDNVALSNWDRSHVVLLLKICRQVTAQELSSDAGRSGEVCLPGLSALARHGYNDSDISTLKQLNGSKKRDSILTLVSLHLKF